MQLRFAIRSQLNAEEGVATAELLVAATEALEVLSAGRALPEAGPLSSVWGVQVRWQVTPPAVLLIMAMAQLLSRHGPTLTPRSSGHRSMREPMHVQMRAMRAFSRTVRMTSACNARGGITKCRFRESAMRRWSAAVLSRLAPMRLNGFWAREARRPDVAMQLLKAALQRWSFHGSSDRSTSRSQLSIQGHLKCPSVLPAAGMVNAAAHHPATGRAAARCPGSIRLLAGS